MMLRTRNDFDIVVIFVNSSPVRLRDSSARRTLFRRLLRQCFDYRDVWEQLRWQVVPFLQVGSTIMSDPNFALSVFPNQNLERKIDGTARRRQHHGSARLWISEDEKFRRTHFQSCFSRFSAVVDQREQGNSLCLKNPSELLDRFLHRVAAKYVD